MATTLQKLSGRNAANLDNRTAWVGGLNIRTAYRLQPEATTAALAGMLDATCQYVDANKSIQGAAALAEAARYLIDQFPVYTLEEWALVLYRVRHGYYAQAYGDRFKIYERLKTEELVRFACKHEEERSYLLEELQRPSPYRGLPEGAETRAYNYQPRGRQGSGQRLREYLDKVAPMPEDN